jgi:hypothetical protein
MIYDSPKCPGNDVDSTRKAIFGGKRKRGGRELHDKVF